MYMHNFTNQLKIHDIIFIFVADSTLAGRILEGLKLITGGNIKVHPDTTAEYYLPNSISKSR